jgi:hypothetical protein
MHDTATAPVTKQDATAAFVANLQATYPTMKINFITRPLADPNPGGLMAPEPRSAHR